jgi:hypothetical protein
VLVNSVRAHGGHFRMAEARGCTAASLRARANCNRLLASIDARRLKS